jgi:GDP-4-dehydro-6-deoxy-D-mannose reductase
MCGDPKKVQKETGWYPQIPMEKTIKDLLDYWRSKCHSEDPIVHP